ncbi:hypothetical protein IAT40_001117 [Kwoniella sp. CBS 6097]
MDWFDFPGTADNAFPLTYDVNKANAKEKRHDQQHHFDWLELWPDLVENNPSLEELHPSTPLSSQHSPTPTLLHTRLLYLSCNIHGTPELSSSLPSPASTRIQTPTIENVSLPPVTPPSSGLPTYGDIGSLHLPSTPPPKNHYDTQRKPWSLDENHTSYGETSDRLAVPWSKSLESPFSRLGLCSPRRRVSTRSPVPSASRSRSPNLCAEESPSPSSPPLRARMALSPPSPGWMPDTPTPARFHTPLNKQSSSPLQIPRQPNFALGLEKSSTVLARGMNADLCLDATSIQHGDRATVQAVVSGRNNAEIKVNWIAHHSTDGGLSTSLRRLRSRIKTEQVSGMNMFLQSPRKRYRSPGREDLLDSQWIMGNLTPEFRANSTIHAVHTTNLISGDPHMRRCSKESILGEMRTARQLGIPTLIIHLGSDSCAGLEEDQEKTMDRMWRLMEDLGDMIRQVPGVTLAIENTVRTSRSPRTSLTTLSSISLLLAHLPHPSIAVCLDLTHLHLSELDLNDPAARETLFQLLKRVQGRIKVLHIGDSCTAHGGRGERHASGHIEVSSIRAILRHPLLHGIPTQLETPPYYRGLRYTTSSSSKRISALEHFRAALERNFVQEIINIPDDEWNLRERAVTKKYFGEKKRLENRIYKVMEKMGRNQRDDRGGGSRDKWRRCRMREVAASRKTQGMKRRKKRSRANSIKSMRDTECQSSGGDVMECEDEFQIKLEKV